MLFQMIENLNRQISTINVAKEVPEFAYQLQKMRPTFKEELRLNGIEEGFVNTAMNILIECQIGIIKQIPTITKQMTDILQSGSGVPSFRCVLATSLVHFVNPKDLLPDDLPGAYGYIDDVLMLQEACAISWEIEGNSALAEERRKAFQFIFQFVPDGSLNKFKYAISSLAQLLNYMNALDSISPDLSEMTTQMLITNPLQSYTPEAQFGTMSVNNKFGNQFLNFQRVEKPQYCWQDGNTIGVNFPGGGGVMADSTGVYPF